MKAARAKLPLPLCLPNGLFSSKTKEKGAESTQFISSSLKSRAMSSRIFEPQQNNLSKLEGFNSSAILATRSLKLSGAIRDSSFSKALSSVSAHRFFASSSVLPRATANNFTYPSKQQAKAGAPGSALVFGVEPYLGARRPTRDVKACNASRGLSGRPAQGAVWGAAFVDRPWEAGLGEEAGTLAARDDASGAAGAAAARALPFPFSAEQAADGEGASFARSQGNRCLWSFKLCNAFCALSCSASFRDEAKAVSTTPRAGMEQTPR